MGHKEGGKAKKGIIAVVFSLLIGFSLGVFVGIKVGQREEVPFEAEGRLRERIPEGNVSEPPSSPELPLTFYEKLEQEGPGLHLKEVEPHLPPQASVEVKKEETQGPIKRAVFLQVGAFKDHRNAKLLTERLRSRGYEADLHPTEVKGMTWYRVLVKFPSPEAAEEAIGRLKKEGVTEVRILKED